MESLIDLIQDQPLALVTFGAVLAVIFGVRHLGLWQGQRAAQQPAGAAQVAAVIVDPTALNANTAAIEAQNMEMVAANISAKRQAEAIEDLSESIEKLRDQLVFIAAKMD